MEIKTLDYWDLNSGGDKAFISVRVQEELFIYQNNQLVSSPPNRSIDYKFELRTEEGRWKIYDRRQISPE